MPIRTRVAAGALAAIAVAGTAAAAQATPHAAGRLAFVSQLTAIQFFTNSGPITGFPATPLVPGDRFPGPGGAAPAAPGHATATGAPHPSSCQVRTRYLTSVCMAS